MACLRYLFDVMMSRDVNHTASGLQMEKTEKRDSTILLLKS